jgi:hypothetical protein
MWRNIFWFMLGAVVGVVIHDFLNPHTEKSNNVAEQEPVPIIKPYVSNKPNSSIKPDDVVVIPPQKVEVYLEPQKKKKHRRIADDD